MEIKLFEVRDRGTFIPAFSIQMCGADNDDERYLLRRAGYGCASLCVLFGRLDGGETHYDPFEWHGGARTMHEAHLHVERNWNDLASGQVICVETILGERETSKVSERLEEPLA